MRTLLLLAALTMPAVSAAADEAIEGELSLGQVREIQLALSSIEKRDGVSIPTCLGDIKPPCIPPAISHAIADDIFALSAHLQFYNAQIHKLIGEASGGTGFIAPGSKEDTIANYRLYDLNEERIKVRLQQIDIHALEASGVQIAPTIKAVLSPISR